MAIVDEEVHEEATPTETPQLDTSDQIIDWFEPMELLSSLKRHIGKSHYLIQRLPM